MTTHNITKADLDELRINDRAPRIEAEHARAVQGEPNGGHAQQKCPHCEGGLGTHTMPSLDGAPCMICASCHQVSLAVDWLEGEPNDDREAIAREAYRELYPGSVNTHDSERTAESDLRESDRAYATWDSGNEGFAPGIICRRIADRVLAAGFSRATVPDAATEGTFKNAEAFDKAVALSERRQTFLEEAEAERDAALDAVERVRAMHRRLNIVDEVTDERLGDACEVCCEIESHELTWPCPTIEALDGAGVEFGDDSHPFSPEALGQD